MRRRPVAVYRVIDEEELLGGDAIDLLGDGFDRPTPRPSAAPAATAPRSWGERSPDRRGWITTALVAGALGCTAALLLLASPHAPARLAPPPRNAARPDRAIAQERLVARPRATAIRVPTHSGRTAVVRRPARPTARPAARLQRRRTRPPERRISSPPHVERGLHSREPAAPDSASTPVSADQEFGFER